MDIQVEFVVVEPADNLLDTVPLVDPDETLQQPKSQAVVHFVPFVPDTFLFSHLLFECAFVSLFVHDRLEEHFVLVLTESDLPFH